MLRPFRPMRITGKMLRPYMGLAAMYIDDACVNGDVQESQRERETWRTALWLFKCEHPHVW